MITKMASEEFTKYNEIGYGLKIIQRSKNKFSKTSSSSCQAIADIEKHILITKDTEKRKSQLSFTHLIGSFCRIFDMSVVVYVEETVLNQKKYSTYIFESEHVKSVIIKNLEQDLVHQNHEMFPYQLFLRLPKNDIDDDLSVVVLIPHCGHKSGENKSTT